MRDRYANLREGLVGAWIPSVSGSGLLLPDLSGQGNNGTLTNMGPEDWVSSQYGRALDFDGVNDYVTPNKAVVTSLPLTFSATFKMTSGNGSNLATILVVGEANQARNVWRLVARGTSQAIDPGKLFAQQFDGTTAGDAYSTTQFVPNEKIHVACVFETNALRSIYINGRLEGTNSTVVNTITNLNYTNIGRLQWSTGDIQHAPMAAYDIRIYNRALSESEIKLLAQEPGVGFKRTRSVFDFGRKPAYLPPTPTDYRTVRVKQTEHASLREGLVGAWCPSIEGSGYTLPDLSGQGNNGALTNMGPEDWVAGEYGRALDFDGSNDYVEIGYSKALDITGPITVSGWIKTTTTQSQVIYGGYQNVSPYPGLAVGLSIPGANAGRLVFWNGGSWTASTSTSYNSGEWTHVAVSYSGSSVSFYKNGFLDGVQAEGATTSWTGPRYLGVNLGAPNYLDGQLDDVRIYNRALSESEIKLLASRPGIGLRNNRKVFDFNKQVTYSPKVSPYYRTIKANKTEHASLREGLVGAWIPSIRGDGLLLPDLSGNGNNGTLTNMGPEDWVSGQYGRVLDFDGVNDQVQVATKGVVTPNRSVSVWFKTSVVFPPSNYGVICKWGTASSFPADIGKDFQVLFGTDGNLGSTGIGITQYGNAVAVSGYNDGKWHHGYFQGKGSLYSVYIDGVFKASKTMTTNATAGTVSIGYGPAGYFPGQLDDIRIYNRVLSESEIKLLASEPGIGFKSSPKTFDFGKQQVIAAPQVAPDYRTVRVKQTEHASLREGLVGAWCPSIEGGGYTLPDLSGQGNNGTLTNMGPEDWASSQYGRALDFDGSNDYVTINPYYTLPFSVSLWFYGRNDTSVQTLFGIGSSTWDSPLFNVALRGDMANDPIVAGMRGNNQASNTYAQVLGFLPNKWNHVLAVFTSASHRQVYLNGIAGTEDTTTHSVEPLDLGTIGALRRTFISSYSNALISDVRIYNRALSEPEIKLLASRPGIGLRPQRRTMYYAPPNIKRNNLLIGNLF